MKSFGNGRRFRVSPRLHDNQEPESYQGTLGFSDITYCNRSYLRKILRELWERARDHGDRPYVAIHDEKTNIIYEGCQVNGWVSSDEGDDRVIVEQQGVGFRSFQARDVIELQIGD